jgi:hypothetical protein
MKHPKNSIQIVVPEKINQCLIVHCPMQKECVGQACPSKIKMFLPNDVLYE